MFGVVVLSGGAVLAAEADRFVQRLLLPGGATIVVAEGDLEPRSIGSYSVRLYSGVNVQFPADDFLAGVIQARDGSVEKVVLADVDGNGREEVVVVVRCVGTGGYLSAYAFAVDQKRLVLQATVADLPRDADPVSALKKTTRKKR